MRRLIYIMAFNLCSFGVVAQQDSIRAGSVAVSMIPTIQGSFYSRGDVADSTSNVLRRRGTTAPSPLPVSCGVYHLDGVCPGYPGTEAHGTIQVDAPKIDSVQVYQAQSPFTSYFVRVKINGVWSEWQKVESNYTKQ